MKTHLCPLVVLAGLGLLILIAPSQATPVCRIRQPQSVLSQSYPSYNQYGYGYQNTYGGYDYNQGYSQNYGHNQGYNYNPPVKVVNIETVAQINPAYLSAYSPDGYDSATQSRILNELQRLGAAVELQTKLAIAMQAAQAAQAGIRMPYADEKRTVPSPGTPDKPPEVIPIPASKLPRIPGPPTKGLAVITAKCAACHQAGKLAPDQRFTILDLRGELAPLTPAMRLKIIGKTYRGEMPPPHNDRGITPLTDEEYASIMDIIG